MCYSEFIIKSKFSKHGWIVNAPAEIEKVFLSLGYTNKKMGKSNATIAFVSNTEEFLQLIPEILSEIENDSIFWVCYPKGTSKVKTDINRDILRKLFEPMDLRPVTQMSIDDTWSAMRFRPADKVKSKK